MFNLSHQTHSHTWWEVSVVVILRKSATTQAIQSQSNVILQQSELDTTVHHICIVYTIHI